MLRACLTEPSAKHQPDLMTPREGLGIVHCTVGCRSEKRKTSSAFWRNSMGGYSFQVGIDLVTCNDTESIHSSDKFALAGAVITDSTRTGFVMPTIRINSGEQREYDRDIRLVFNGIANVPTLGIVLQAWDLDQNDNWVE